MGDTSRGNTDILYQVALSDLDDIVTREPLSNCFYESHSINHREGFDSLPLFMGRHHLLDLRPDTINSNKIVLCGGISYNESAVPLIVKSLLTSCKKSAFEFLVGGKTDLAQEDFRILDLFKNAGLQIRIKKADNFEDWCQSIANAQFLLSGRFHYTVAAMALGVPCISFPSNTPKTRGIYQMFDLDGFLEWTEQQFGSALEHLIMRASVGDLSLTAYQRAKMIEKAEENYTNF